MTVPDSKDRRRETDDEAWNRTGGQPEESGDDDLTGAADDDYEALPEDADLVDDLGADGEEGPPEDEAEAPLARRAKAEYDFLDERDPEKRRQAFLAASQEDPEAVMAAMLRQRDYTKKTQDLAEERRQLERERVRMETRREGEAQAQPVEQPVIAEAADLAEYQRWGQAFVQKHGREPNALDVARYEAQRTVRELVSPTVQQVETMRYQALLEMGQRELAQLQEEFAEAADPEVQQEMLEFMNRTGMADNLQSGDLRKVFHAVTADRRSAARQQEAREARTAQRAARQGRPTVAPGPTGRAPAPPPARTFDEVVARQKRDPKLRALLGR